MILGRYTVHNISKFSSRGSAPHPLLQEAKSCSHQSVYIFTLHCDRGPSLETSRSSTHAHQAMHASLCMTTMQRSTLRRDSLIASSPSYTVRYIESGRYNLIFTFYLLHDNSYLPTFIQPRAQLAWARQEPQTPLNGRKNRQAAKAQLGPLSSIQLMYMFTNRHGVSPM